ncbi:MAG: hypothetical protein H6581_11235 [Bacteroidia bacterium]|nr:hypothetical protein [Bacteroidia bacterium]
MVLAIHPSCKAQVVPPADSLQTDSAQTKTSTKSKGTNTAVPDSASATKTRTKTSQGDVLISKENENPFKELGVPDPEPEKSKPLKIFDPDKAWKRSAILPGWGQFYNKTYWKPPIVYAGFGTLVYLWVFNNNNYLSTRTDYLCSLDPNCAGFSSISTQTLKNEREFYRRNRDLSAIVGVIWYLLNVVDAYVEAHLKDFNVTDDISMRIKPALDYNTRRGQMTVGATLSFGFK